MQEQDFEKIWSQVKEDVNNRVKKGSFTRALLYGGQGRAIPSPIRAIVRRKGLFIPVSSSDMLLKKLEAFNTVAKQLLTKSITRETLSEAHKNPKKNIVNFLKELGGQ